MLRVAEGVFAVQKTVGTVVKTTDSVDPIAVLTVLPLKRYTALKCLKEIRSYLEAKCTGKVKHQLQQVSCCQLLYCTILGLCIILQPTADRADRVLQSWDDPNCGLLLSERLVNCPPQLAPPLNQALFDEVAWAQEDEPTQVSMVLHACWEMQIHCNML